MQHTVIKALLAATLSLALVVIHTSPTFAHGGGCRKSSPPGQCCHMQTSVGIVHCH